MKNIIIGGTHGLGQEIAKKLQASGEETYVVGRSYDEAEHGDGLKVDLSKAEEARQLANTVKELGTSAISFFWVSGYGYNGDFAEQESPENMAAVNFGNVLPAAQQAFKSMLALQEVSHFVVVSSTTGYKARSDEAVYAGTKHAQVGFTRSLGLEAERLQSSVRVALFMPGGMQTPFWEGNQPGSYNEFLDPSKVAEHMVTVAEGQSATFYEEVIERGSL
jgi:short-subunit dehydrogenase